MGKKRQPIDANTEIKILKLENKDFKVALTKMLQQAIKKMLKTNGKKETSSAKK